jgi:hypothetical protein
MAEISKYPCPPYATFSPLLNFLNKLRDTQVPSRIDPSVFGNASGSLSYSVIAALKVLKLITSEGTPTGAFVALVNADDDARKALLRDSLPIAYPTFFDGTFDIKKATAGQFDEHIRDRYEAKGSTIDKVAAFFIHAANYADVEISQLIKDRKAISSSATSGKSRKQRKQAQEETGVGAAGAGGAKVTPPTPASQPLEYQLVDLLKDDDITDEESGAIWTLVRFLTTKKKKAAKPSAKPPSPDPSDPPAMFD